MTIQPDAPEVQAPALDEPAAPPAPPVPMTPTVGAERVELIDIVRGIALFGIFAANIRGFAGPALAYFNPNIFWHETYDKVAQAFVDTFIQGKFITIFAVLFGVGFTAQLTRAAARNAKFGWTYARLFILVLFGLAHGLFIWFGDILLVYGVTGFFLFFFRKRMDKTVATWAIVGYLVPLLMMSIMFFVSLSGAKIPAPPTPTPQQLADTVRVFADGSWAEIQKARTTDAVSHNWGYLPIMLLHILGLFLAGVLAWRHDFFRPSIDELPKYKRWMMWGFAIGISGNVAATALRWALDIQPFPPSGPSVLIFAINMIAVPALSLAYVCAIILMYHSEAWRARIQRFGAIGKTALSNYLLQSIVGTLMFYSYGLGFFGKVGPALLLIPTVLVYALQAVISPWWVARFHFGPAEWVWRSLTYGKLQPFVRRPESAPIQETTAA
jgi:uncharacterized protein